MEKHLKHLRPIWHLAWPAILEMFFQTVVTYADVAMVGRLGAEASASVGLTGSVGWLFSCILSALGVGCVAFIARAVGSGKQERAHTAAVQALWLVLISGGALTVLAQAVHNRLPVWMNAAPEIQSSAAQYFSIIMMPLVFRASIVIFGSVLRGAGDTRTPMIANVGMNVLNVILNFLLIYPSRTIVIGSLSCPLPGAGLGVAGAAIASALSFVVGGIFMFLAVWRNKLVTPSAAPIKWNAPVMGEICRVAMPVVIQRVISCLGYITFAALVAKLGTVSLAANSIATSAEELFYIAGYGIQSAAATLGGNALGARSEEKFRTMVRYSLLLAVVFMSFSGLILFLIPTQIMSLFSTDPQVVALGGAVLRIVALSEPIFGVMVVCEGIFNGIGDTKAPVYYALATMWGIRILFSALCILVFDLGLKAVWVCMVADNTARAILLMTRYLRGRWRYRFLQENHLFE